MAASASEECLGVSVVEISAQSDKTVWRLSVSQFSTKHEKPVLRKTRDMFDLCIFSPRKVKSLVFKDFIGSFVSRI